jgi:sugar phosphate isomerase/epimerase
MTSFNRREFLKTTIAAGVAATGFGAGPAPVGEAAKVKRKFTVCLAPGLINLSADPQKLIAWAEQFGFESIEPPMQFLSKLSDAQLQEYLEQMRQKNLAWGAVGLSTDFRGTDAAFQQGMQSLPDSAKAMRRAGVTRISTWISPNHRTLTYMANFRQHARRLREVAKVLGDQGVRLGLEYVGPKTAWSNGRFPFIHTMAEMKDLLAEMNCDNVGFLLDSWHWYTAQETQADLLTLRNSDVVQCHLNDAPQGVAVDQQVDNRRGLPCATGVIDAKGFLGAMIKIGFDGPVACEPFSQELRAMKPEQALAAVSAAMKKAVGLAES